MTNKDYEPLTTCGYANPKMLPQYRDRLCYLEDCIKNGTLVFLPCKVGDTVWFVNKCRIEKPIEAYIVDTIKILQSGIISIEVHQAEPPYGAGLIRNDYFGRNVFKTKEAAEKELEELRNNVF